MRDQDFDLCLRGNGTGMVCGKSKSHRGQSRCRFSRKPEEADRIVRAKTKQATVTKVERFSLKAKQIRELLERSGEFELDASNKVSVTFQVPSGGDMSGTILDLAEHPIEVTIETVTQTKD